MIDQPGADLYPQGEAIQAQIKKRHRTGRIWRYLFFTALVLAIITLIVLMLNIINQSFGLVAEQNAVPPNMLVRDYQEGRLLSASNVVTSEDDFYLAEEIGADPQATGFFGYAFFKNNEEQLKALTIDGVAPNAETVNNGEYPLTRPLYIYTTADILNSKPEVAAFVQYYLDNAPAVVKGVGYFPAGTEELNAAKATVANALESGGGTVNPADHAGTIVASGSSTVWPVTSAMSIWFEEDGFAGDVIVERVGTTGGFQDFCYAATTDVDIVNASRPISQLEFEACRSHDREPLEIRIGTDALAVVVNHENDFVSDVSQAELQNLFVETENWSAVNSAWPAAPIRRFIPSEDSGTLDFFVDTVFDTNLEDLPYDSLVEILAGGISLNVGRRLEREQRFYADTLVFEDQATWDEVCAEAEPPAGCTAPPRDQNNVFLLVQERIVQPQFLETWYLWPSLTQRDEIVRTVAEKYPNAEVIFQSWINGQFITSPQSSTPEIAGIRTAILGSLWVIAITFLFSFPLGVGAAIYLEEYADHTKRFNQIIQTNINNLAGVPSIIYGMLGLAVFVRLLEPLTSGAVFGAVESGVTANGRTILSAGLTLGLLILPIIIISAQESIRAVPGSLRQASLGLGATKWQTIWNHVLPNALPGILTGTILSMSRAIGETAPLVVVGASTFITFDPTGPFSKFTVLPIQIYQWTARPQQIFRNLAGAAIIVLLFLLLTMNATAIYLRNRFSKRMG
jgi:phosphate transport system permease protein